jgi:saccharopine dehydrogenase-like NADP-dependent oxidoreductase
MNKITILGAGMVGRAMAIDLSSSYEVTSADTDKRSLESLSSGFRIKTIRCDLSDTGKVTGIIKDADLVICALPGSMGYSTIQAIIRAGKNLVDISFMPEDFLMLNGLAVEKKVTAVVDCGVAPGMPNLLAGYHNVNMKIADFEYMVGGLPKERKFPFEYKAPFSPADVIEEYTRPARYVENGKLVTKPAMSDPELVYFPGIGHLEAFNTDGLRSLMTTLKDVPNMKEKTLRYPGHIRLIQGLKATGFFSRDPVTVNGSDVIPFDFTTKLLFNDWKLGAGECEFTVMRVKITGDEGSVSKEIIYELYDETDRESGISSMARTTGFTATAAANLMLTGGFTRKGVFPPELVGCYPECAQYILNYLKERKLIYRKTENIL